jgi:rare lipoprotein A
LDLSLRLRGFIRAVRPAIAVLIIAPFLVACSGGGLGVPHVERKAFSSKEFGVAVSPRLSTAKNPPRGGGRLLVGKPYTVRGVTYTPQQDPTGYVASGSASWYGADFHGRQTANGEIFSANAISGAHPTLPLPSYVRVTNLDNGRSMLVRVNDRGPYLHGRVMDLSYRAAEMLGYANKGVGNLQVQYVGPAPLNGDDTRMLLASVDKPTQLERGNTRLAFNAGPAATPDPLGDLIGLFGYAEPTAVDASINAAHAAANDMATRADALQPWVASVDDDARAIDLRLGLFTSTERSDTVASAFAMLGAVTENPVRIAAGDATELRLTHLRPGVARDDVLSLARELGLDDLVLY